ncbi:unnamed protein product [Phaeothamnion confervicola]
MTSQEELAAKRARPITADGDRPNKRFYRSRAHCNPLSHNESFDHPPNPADVSWTLYYPGLKEPCVTVLDVGCGFGGLTVALATALPHEVILAMEIRPKVCEFVRLRIEALRKEHPGQYQNAAAMRTNSMLYLPNFVKKAQLSKMFFCFPDPHFKAKNHRRRIVSAALLAEYAYFLRPGGLLYTITDVEELHRWHIEKASSHPAFERVPDEEAALDPATAAMRCETEEGKKVERNGGAKHWAVFRRRPDDEVAFSLLAPVEETGRVAEAGGTAHAEGGKGRK